MTSAGFSVIGLPRVYFDTRDVINMIEIDLGQARLTDVRRDAYTRIANAVKFGRCTVLFNPAACFEWVEAANRRPWREFADFFLSAGHAGIEVDTNFAYLFELIEELRRVAPELRVPPNDALRPIGQVSPAFLALSHHHPDLAAYRTMSPLPPQEWKQGLLEWSERAEHRYQNDRASMRQRIDDWRYAVMLTRAEFRRRNANRVNAFAWAKVQQRLGDVVASCNPEIDLDALASEFDVTQCRACSIFLNAYWRYAKGCPDKGPHDNDSDDWGQVAAIALADFSLIETPLCRHLCAGTPSLRDTVFCDPVEFASAIGL